jgi:ADP-ribose pyrophosphatase
MAEHIAFRTPAETGPAPAPPQTPPGEALWRERRFELRVCDLPLRGGAIERRGVVVHGGSVVILAITADERIVFIENRRWQIGRTLLELPAGTLEPGEDPAQAAARELGEETGFACDTVRPLSVCQALPGITTEVIHGFLATGLRVVGQNLEADEDIGVVCLSRAEAARRLREGEIQDLKTIAMLGLYLLISGSG